MTGGRVSLGFGLGWMREEFALLGEDFDTRAARADEMVLVMRKLWTGEMVEHHGRFYDFGPLNMRPAVPDPIEILVGGTTDAAFRRIGRYGDGWLPPALTIAQARDGIERIRREREACGRAGAPITAVVPLKDARDRDAYLRAEDAGVTHALTAPWLVYGGSHRSLADKRAGLVRFADEVIAKLQR
jgi:alkanesulfonate monooxygenase SsuD/methylene tetrahydromethanopterin reductase-like flavin-dependent oxidoreductase (luciferase family)